MVRRTSPAVVAALALALGTVFACGELNVTAVDVARVEVVPDTASVAVGATRRLNARLLDASGNELLGRPISWSSSDPAHALADDDGTITGVAPGVAMIRATSGAVTGEARVNVVAAPSLGVSPDRINFALQQGAPPDSRLVSISNSGGPVSGLTATVQYAQGGPGGWLDANLQGTTPPTTIGITATTGSLAPGTYTAAVVIEGGSGAASATIPVELQVTAPAPAIALSASSVTFAVAEGAADPAAQTVAIANGGGGSLTGLGASVTYAGQTTGWLTASLSPSTAPSTLTLAAQTATLPQGVYDATVNVVSPVAGNSPQSVAVRLTVGAPPPSIELSETSRPFTATAGGPDPGAHAIAVTNGGGGTLDGLTATVLYTAGQPGDWLTAALSATTAPATLTLQPRAGALAPGTYTATVRVASPAATNSPRDIAVTFELAAPTNAPAIGLSQDTATFTAVVGGASPASRVVQVTNTGGGTLDGLASTVAYGAGQPTGWLSATLGSTAAPTTLTLQPATGTLAAGTYTATVEVAATGASNSPRTIGVTFQVTAAPVAPAIALAPTTAEFTAVTLTGNPASKSVQITNSGGGTLTDLTTAITYGSGQPGGWLTASLGSTTAPATLTLQPVTGVLLPGTYTAMVEVRSAVASNSPQTVAVTFQVTAPIIPPAIGLSSTSAAFDATTGGGNPASQSVSVTNTGGGTLDDLTSAIVYGSGQPTGWLTATLGSATAPTQLTLQATTGTLPAGTYNATVQVRSAKASNSPQTVAVTFVVAAAPVPPAIGLGSSTASFSAAQGGGNPASQSVSVTNTGGGTLDDLTTAIVYGSGQPTGWLTATLGSTTAPTQLTLQAATGTLAAGTYNATVEVRSAKANNSPQTIAVTFQVNATAPAPVTNLQARARGDDEIELTWTDNSSNETHFIVQRSVSGGGGPYVDVVTLPPNTVTYRDQGLQSDTRYWYRIQACNSAGCAVSSSVSERTDD